jgi:hypothetical protein
MTVMMIRKLAKEIAGMFYEQADGGALWGDDPERSPMFRDTFPTVGDFLRGYQRCAANFCPVLGPDGQPVEKIYFRVQGSDRWWKIGTPGWHYHVEVARQRLVQMLTEPDVSQHEKRAIADALIEENARATSPQARSLLQRRLAGKVQVNG